MPNTARAIRRGLPRSPGGEPWPPVGEVAPIAIEPMAEGESATPPAPGPGATVSAVAPRRRGLPRVAGGEPPVEAAPAADAVSAPSAESRPEISAPLAPPVQAAPAHPPRWWITRGVLGVVGLVLVAAVVVLAARGVTTLPGVPDFLATYPGEYPLPAFVDPGFPAWANWAHFLNFFFLVMIVQSGLRVRHQRKPPAFYTPKRGGAKVSINLWLHTSLDVLWFVNGVVFVVLLFVSGHWARIVPTSWDVFPNALSAMLQYLTLEWPHENGWVNYNSLQQLSYFVVVFIAAPVAVISGIRMSQWWPKNATTLDKIYPAPLARAIHFPTMLFFVLFVVVHVVLVFGTGALNNLNHMFAGSNEVSWAGFWWFAGGLVVTVGAALATRPLVLAPIAGVSGRVSNR